MSGRPRLGSTLFLQPLYNNITRSNHLRSPRFFGFAANTACRCLLDFAASCTAPWTPPLSFSATTPLLSSYTFFVDAAIHPPLYHVGLFSAPLGLQVHVSPASIQTQQMAELFALRFGLKLATSLRFPFLHLVGDNLGALSSFLHLTGRPLNFIQIKLLRNIFNLLWWSQIPVALYWTPSALHPADPPSRLFHHSNPSPFQSIFVHYRNIKSSLSRLTPLSWVLYPSDFQQHTYRHRAQMMLLLVANPLLGRLTFFAIPTYATSPLPRI